MDAGTYHVAFKAARRISFGGSQTIAVFIDTINLGTYTPSSGTFTSFTTDDFSILTGEHTLKFLGLNSGDNTDFIDDVSIVPGTHTKAEQTVGADEKVSINVLPNPFNPRLTVIVSGWNTGAELVVLNVNGQIVADLTVALKNYSNDRRISRQVVWDASGHASGIYLVVLKNRDSVHKRMITLIR
jgi:hypothetical protein